MVGFGIEEKKLPKNPETVLRACVSRFISVAVFATDDVCNDLCSKVFEFHGDEFAMIEMLYSCNREKSSNT